MGEAVDAQSVYHKYLIENALLRRKSGGPFRNFENVKNSDTHL
jgi:hypothetical protein